MGAFGDPEVYGLAMPCRDVVPAAPSIPAQCTDARWAQLTRSQPAHIRARNRLASPRWQQRALCAAAAVCAAAIVAALLMGGPR